MGYEFHILREGHYERVAGSAITEEEWAAAVQSVPGLRLSDSAPITGANPRTGATISIARRPSDVELFFPEDNRYPEISGKWIPTFRYARGSASFKPPVDIEDPDDPVRIAAAALAHALGARIEGDEGEVYDW